MKGRPTGKVFKSNKRCRQSTYLHIYVGIVKSCMDYTEMKKNNYGGSATYCIPTLMGNMCEGTYPSMLF